MSKILDYAVNRLKERSTWVGILMVITALGVNINPALQQAIIFLGMALAGAPDDKIGKPFVKKEADPEPPLDEVIVHKPVKTIKEKVDEDSKKSVNDLLDSDD